MPHILPGSSSANPSNHCFSNSPIKMQLTTRAMARVHVGRPSSWTAAQFPADDRTAPRIPEGSPGLSGMPRKTDRLDPRW